MMQIWRDDPDSNCAWADPASERWYALGDPGKQSWPVPEAVAVKLMQMGAAAQREKADYDMDKCGVVTLKFE